MTIEARGMKYGIEFRVTVQKKDNKCKYVIDKCEDRYKEAFLSIIKDNLSKHYVFAGTYIPQEDEEDINILNVIQNYLFDELIYIKSEDVTPMPYEKGVVY